jgi:hypothetical protein
MSLLNEQEFQFSPPPLEKFLKKYGEGRRRRSMEPLYQRMSDEAQQHVRPQFLFAEFSTAETIELQPWLSSDTDSVIFGVCTLGQELHNRLQQLGEDDTVAQYVLNEVAIEWLRSMVMKLHRTLRQEMAVQGRKAGPTYRPGVGRWPLETQRVVFAHLAAETIGVTLDEHLVMIPILSNSLIIPVFKRPSVDVNDIYNLHRTFND